MSSDHSLPKGIWILLAGLGAGGFLVMLAVAAFVAWKLISPRSSAEQQTGQQQAAQPTNQPPTALQTPAQDAVAQQADTGQTPSPQSATSEQAVAENATPPSQQSGTTKRFSNRASRIRRRRSTVNEESSQPPAPVLTSGPGREIVQLPAPLRQIVVAGSGKYLIGSLPSVKKVAVIDVASKKIARLIPVDDEDILIAGGETRFVVLQRSQETLARYNLQTGELEATAPSDPFNGMAMGSSSEGPIVAVGSRQFVLDLQTLKPVESRQTRAFGSDRPQSPPSGLSRRVATHLNDDANLAASADGRVFGSWRSSGSPTGMAVIEIDRDEVHSSYEHVSNGAVIPSADGRVIYSGRGRYDVKCKPMGDHPVTHEAMLMLPAATGPFYLRWVYAEDFTRVGSSPMSLTILHQNDDIPLVTVKDIVLPDIVRSSRLPRNATPPFQQRLFWLPVTDCLVAVPSTFDRLVIQHFNLKEQLDKSGADYFLVTSVPPAAWPRGQQSTYPIRVLSKQEDAAHFTLESGPPGMSISQKGELSWTPAANFSGEDALAIVKIRGPAGQELSHTIKLKVVDSNVGATADAAPSPAPQSVRMPAAIQQLVVGASGKYLVANIPQLKKVAVIDVAARKIAQLIPIDDNDALIAAGETKFVVLSRGQGMMARYDFNSFKQEQSEACDGYNAIALGSSSEGPLLAVGPTPAAIDLQTLKPTPMKVAIPFGSESLALMASASSKVFGGRRVSTFPNGMTILEINGNNLQSTYQHTSDGPVIPSPDGRVIYAIGRRFDVKGNPIGDYANTSESAILLPAATGPFYMRWVMRDFSRGFNSSSMKLTIHCQSDDNPILTVKNVVLPDLSFIPSPNAPPPTLPNERRIFWTPVADTLLIVPIGSDQIVFQHFNLTEQLQKGGRDYFFVVSIPPRMFQRGQKLSYAIEVVSKHGNTQYTLESGPAGAAVSADGVVTWNVPSDFAPHEAVVVVRLKDGSGQELAHTIKLTDGQSKLVDRRSSLPPDGSSFAVRTTPTPRTFPERRIQPVSAPPKSMGDNRWQWTGGSPVCVRGEKGNFGGIILGDKLYLVKDNGALSTEPVTLPANYLHAGLRSSGIVGVAANPTRVEILDRHGKLLHKVLLQNVAPKGLALHPTKPICYVCLDLIVPPFRGAFVAVDERAATVKAGDENLGHDVTVDPTGRFLVSTYVHSIHVGDQIVVSQSPIGPRRPGVPGRVPGYGRYRGRSLPSGPAPRVNLFHRYAHVAVMLVYDLESPLQPEFHTFTPLQSIPGPMRISHDGRRLTTHPPDNKLAKYSACDPLDLKAPSINYEFAGGQGGSVIGSDVAFHPMFPLNAVVSAGTAAFFDSESGKPLPNAEKLDLPDLATLSVRRAMFSADGKQLVVLASGNTGEQTLVRAALPLSAAEQTAMRKRAVSPSKSLKSNAPPLADMTAWRGGLSQAATVAQIAANYSDSVVIVRTGTSTGSGFFVGSSGLILTCAHCVSPLEPVQVVYHPQGKPDEKINVEATVVHRDRKTDLALLKIDVKQPLHSVALADPVDVKSGEDVTIIANPGLGNDVLDNTVTSGIISNIKRKIGDNYYIQSSAAVNPGSSGGPMFDRNGQVIGVVVLKAGIDGVGFAVPPTPITKFLLRATRRGGNQGQLERNWVDSGMKHEIRGNLMGISKESVTLLDKSNGQTITRSLSDFSPGDRKLLDLLAANE